MKYVIEAFSILFTLMAGLYGSVSVISVSGQIAACTYDALGDLNTAEVILTYEYNLPFFGVSGTRTTRGIAR